MGIIKNVLQKVVKQGYDEKETYSRKSMSKSIRMKEKKGGLSKRNISLPKITFVSARSPTGHHKSCKLS